MKNKTTLPLTILKIGGRTIDDHSEQQKILAAFAAMNTPKILVHGGGKQTNQWCEKMGIPIKMHQGRRITDQPTLEVVTMLYAGLINKTLVGALQARGTNAIGLCGADAQTIKAHKRPVGAVDFGMVGDIDFVDHQAIQYLLAGGMTPVFCALTVDQHGQLLNTNADTIASKLAAAMGAFYNVRLWLCMDFPGVLRDPNDFDSVVPEMDPVTYRHLVNKEVISGGMIPKMDNAFWAVQHGAQEVWIGNIETLTNHSATKITSHVEPN